MTAFERLNEHQDNKHRDAPADHLHHLRLSLSQSAASCVEFSSNQNSFGRLEEEWNPGLAVTGDVGGCGLLISCEVNTVHVPQLLLTCAEATFTHSHTIAQEERF